MAIPAIQPGGVAVGRPTAWWRRRWWWRRHIPARRRQCLKLRAQSAAWLARLGRRVRRVRCGGLSTMLGGLAAFGVSKATAQIE
jgi:hypothetical protein